MDTTQTKGYFHALLAQKLMDEFAARNIEGFYCETKEHGLKKVLEIIPKDSLVSWGGSASLHEIGVLRAIKNQGYNFIDPAEPEGGRAKQKAAREALSADYFLMSANAISVTGEIINLDGIGNRVAALGFGPQHVIIIAGMNKVEPTLEAAILRAKTYAAPLTLLTYKRDYASLTELSQAAENAWSHLVVTRMSTIKGRITVILVGEDLGY